MPPIYPPLGPQDVERFRKLKKEDREYLRFSLDFCSQILECRPSQTEVLEMAANHLTALGFYTDGLKLDLRLARIRPNDPGVLYNLACSYSLTGRMDDAMDTLWKAADNGYIDYLHMARDDDLAALRHDPRFDRLVATMRQRARERAKEE